MIPAYNEYNGGESGEPEFQYIPDTPKTTNGHHGSISPLQESVLLLSDSLANSNALVQFEVQNYFLIRQNFKEKKTK